MSRAPRRGLSALLRRPDGRPWIRWFARTDEEHRIARESMHQLTERERWHVAIAVGLGVFAAALVAGVLWFLLGVVLTAR